MTMSASLQLRPCYGMNDERTKKNIRQSYQNLHIGFAWHMKDVGLSALNESAFNEVFPSVFSSSSG